MSDLPKWRINLESDGYHFTFAGWMHKWAQEDIRGVSFTICVINVMLMDIGIITT